MKSLRRKQIELREQVEEVSVDMWGGFPRVVQLVLTNARLVFDRFHVMQPVNEELNKIRRQTGMILKGSKFILLKTGADLTEAEQIKLVSILAHSQRLRLAYELKEDFRNIFEACHTVEEGKAQFLLWLKKARTVYCDALITIRNHLDGICNHFSSRTTSGVMEGINNKFKLIKRKAYGFVNFDNFRARLLSCFSH